LLLDTETPGVVDALGALGEAVGVDMLPTQEGVAYRLSTEEEAVDLRPAIFALARDNGWPLRELRRDVRTLESVFNELVTSVEGGAS
ncbi:MAG: hypothetical protein PVG11_03500, partial [Anaerolineae bacterium]